MGINVLIMGSGAREHAMAEAVLRSPLLGKLFLAEAGEAKSGTTVDCIFKSLQAGAKLGKIISYDDFEDLAVKCVEKEINMAIFGSESPLCEGIVDIFKKHNIDCIGVDKNYSQLESSKLFAKNFMKKHKIKTANFSVVTEKNLPNYDKIKYPIVIKADGLCGGKGVVISNNKAFAERTVNEFLGGKFGENSKTILLEEFLQGEEISLMSIWDGKSLLTFAPSRDFKKLNKSESAPNTGGMGAFCPVKISTFQQRKLEEYKTQLENVLSREEADFCGFIYSGLIWTQKDGIWDWYVLEYNVRLGDPEAQVTLAHLESDFLKILQAALKQNLDKISLNYNEGYSACLVLACQGYPKEPRDGETIYVPENRDIKVFYSGVVKDENGQLFSKGGRVLSLCTTADSPFPILKEFALKIKMENKYFRTDIEVRN